MDRRAARLTAVTFLCLGSAIAADTFTPAQRKYWAFQPVVQPQLPTLHHKSAVATPIDAFIAAKLDAKGLQLSTRADRVTLIRRVTFDLIGLPPTPEEVDAFVADKSPKAYEKVVDRLLASPRYGERRARHRPGPGSLAQDGGIKS